MCKAFRILIVPAFLLVFAANVWATPVSFTTDPSTSSVSVTDTATLANVTGTIVLPSESFTLSDNATEILPFFSLTTCGIALDKTYNVTATIEFSTPPITGAGSGGGVFSTLFGFISAGTLAWTTQPADITLADGNTINISFESGWAIFNNTVTVDACVKNLGGASPVPEPSTLLLLGLGLAGLAAYKRFKTA